MVKEAITPPISEKKGLTQSTKHRNDKHLIEQKIHQESIKLKILNQ